MSDDANKVGYGQPPTHSQWKPGQSGNPSGRPKKSVRLVEVLLAEANALITITENGQTKDVPKLQAAVKSLMARAIKGDTKAMALLLKHWNPTEIAALEWHAEQSHKNLMKAYAKAESLIAELRAGRETAAAATSAEDRDPEWEAFRKASDEAEKKGELLTWDQWLESKGVPERYIGED